MNYCTDSCLRSAIRPKGFVNNANALIISLVKSGGKLKAVAEDTKLIDIINCNYGSAFEDVSR